MKYFSLRLLINCGMVFLTKLTLAQNILTNSGFNNPAYIEPFYVIPHLLNKWCSWAIKIGIVSASRQYQFGNRLVIGAYVTEVWQGTNHLTVKLIKQ